MPTATTAPKRTDASVKRPRGTNTRKPSKNQGHRYGRIKRDGDEDIVREAQSDYDESESVKSEDEDDSHSESSAASVPDSQLPSLPSSSQSQPTPADSHGHDSTFSDASDPGTSSGKLLLEALRQPRLDWSDAVQQSEGNVPVIQFDEMAPHDAAEKEEIAEDADTSHPAAAKQHQRGGPAGFRRHVGMSARQVYLKRLENDPAYTPRVGEFWGHDERLLDKDLRSLSGWWRGKWTGGRGGFGPASTSDRGRGFARAALRGSWKANGHTPTSPDPQDPVEQAWKHDGFEEMKKVEETHEAQMRTDSDVATRGGSWIGGRGRGRGGLTHGSSSHLNRAVRSNSAASQPSPVSQISTRPYPHARSQSTTWNRYEHAWTKHAVTFLFQDALNRPKNGEDVGVRVRLPGQHRFNVVRISKANSDHKSVVAPQMPPRNFIVKLPRSSKSPNVKMAPVPETAHTIPSPPIDDMASETMRETPKGIEVMTSDVTTTPAVPVISASPQLEPARTQPPVLDKEDLPKAPDSIALQLRTNFPESTPSPAYSSPSYGPSYQYPAPRSSVAYPHPPMPSGDQPVWFDPRMPYGYPTPPPPPGQMCTPPPQVHPAHHHSHTMSHHSNAAAPAYYGQAPVHMSEYHSAPPMIEYAATSQPESRAPPSFAYGADGAMVDAQTGTPIFSLPRSATKIAIRKPGDGEMPSDSASAAQSSSISQERPVTTARRQSVGGTGTTETASNEHVPKYPQPLPQERMVPQPGFAPMHVRHPSQQFWVGYAHPPPPPPPTQGGYYYQQPVYAVPQPQDYAYGQPMPGPPPPMPGYPQPRYNDGMEYQPPVYY